MTKALKFLVIDGYTKEARDQLQSGGASLAANLYVTMFQNCSPYPTECEILFPSDNGAKMPSPAKLAEYDGIAWTGCSLCINDDCSTVTNQLQIAKDAFEIGVPSFGTCWGVQIAVVAAGGRVQPNPKGREMGFARKVCLTHEGRGHLFYHGKTSVFDAFTSHDDEITHLPSGAIVLAGNPWTRVQAVSVTHKKGTAWALQYHPEYDLHEMARLTYCRIEKLIRCGFFRDEESANEHVNQLEELHKDHSRKDLAWKLGIDDDIMNETVRQQEVANWINYLVIPTKQLK